MKVSACIDDEPRHDGPWKAPASKPYQLLHLLSLFGTRLENLHRHFLLHLIPFLAGHYLYQRVFSSIVAQPYSRFELPTVISCIASEPGNPSQWPAQINIKKPRLIGSS